MIAEHVRPRVALIVLAALLAITASMQARAQGTDDLEALSKQVVALYGQAKYAEATEVAKHLLALAEQKFGPDHPSVAPPLNNLALLYVKQDRYAEAEPLYKRSLALREKALGPDHPSVGT